MQKSRKEKTAELTGESARLITNIRNLTDMTKY